MSKTHGMELPKGWAEANLGDVLQVIRGVTYRKEESRKSPDGGFIPVLRATNIQGILGFEDLVYVPAKDVSEIQTLRSGDVVVAASSGSLSVVGKAAQLKHEWAGSFGAFCFCLRPEPAVESRVLGWFLHTLEYRNRVSKVAAGVNINNLRAEHIEQTPFRIPPFGEQERIADALDELLSDLDAGVAALERVRAKLKHFRAAVLKAAVEGALTADWRTKHPDAEPACNLLARILSERRRRWEEAQLQKFKAAGKAPPKDWKEKYEEPAAPENTKLPSLPEGWAVASMDALTCRITSGSRDWQQYYGHGSGTFVMAQNVRPGHLDMSYRQSVSPPVSDSSCERSLVECDDLLVTIVGANTGDVCRVRESLAEHYVCQSVALMRPVLHETGCFLETYFNSPGGGQFHFFRYLYGAGRPHLSFDQLKMTPVLLPSLAEQEAIVEAVEDQLSVIDHLEADLDARLKSAQALRQSILRHAFTGQLVPQDPSDEPAGELLKRIIAEREHRTRQANATKSRKPPARCGRRK
ncbi:MAG: restriction endonuclease subunit S [Terrimicrobiaceae bacterium]